MGPKSKKRKKEEPLPCYSFTSDIHQLDPEKELKDQLLALNFQQKLKVAFTSSPNLFREFVLLSEKFHTSVEPGAIKSNFEKIEKIFKDIHRHDLHIDFIHMMTQSQAIICGVISTYMEYETARNLYYLLERFFDVEEPEKEENKENEPAKEEQKEKKVKKRQKMKTFAEFTKK